MNDLPEWKESLIVVTDQGPSTGIGHYAESLTRLIRPFVSNVRLVSLCYLPHDAAAGWERLPNSVYASSTAEIPRAILQNYRILANSVTSDTPIHFCGASYLQLKKFNRSIATVHDYYPRIPAIENLSHPLVLLRDLSALANYIALPRMVKSARERVVPSDDVGVRLMEGCSLESKVIHHWIDESKFHPRDKANARRVLDLPEDMTLLLNVSVGASNKNYGLMGAIARSLDPRTRLVKVGGALRGCRNVIHLARQEEESYPLLFNACDAYLHTSKREGFGWPLIEAMASRLPVVSLASTVAKEVLGDSALYLDSSDSVSDWICAIRELNVTDFRDEMVRRLRIRSEQFESSRAASEYVNLYGRVFS